MTLGRVATGFQILGQEISKHLFSFEEIDIAKFSEIEIKLFLSVLVHNFEMMLTYFCSK